MSWSKLARARAPQGKPYLELVRGSRGRARLLLRAANHEIVLETRPFDSNDGADSEGDARKAAQRVARLIASVRSIAVVDREMKHTDAARIANVVNCRCDPVGRRR